MSSSDSETRITKAYLFQELARQTPERCTPTLFPLVQRRPGVSIEREVDFNNPQNDCVKLTSYSYYLPALIGQACSASVVRRFDEAGWERLHPGQAGFRSHYSTYMNASVVNHLLPSKARTTAVFLNFRPHLTLSAMQSSSQCYSKLVLSKKEFN